MVQMRPQHRLAGRGLRADGDNLSNILQLSARNIRPTLSFSSCK